MKQNTVQKPNVEETPDFIKRVKTEALEQIEFLKNVASQQTGGLGFADIGAKIAFEEGKLRAITDIKLHIESVRKAYGLEEIF